VDYLNIIKVLKKSPLAKEGDFFLHSEHKKFALWRYIHITICEKIAPPLFGREKFAPTTAIFLTWATFPVVNKTLIS